MRRYTDSGWIDPAPLEVERPRLPWWTTSPRKLLLVASPLIVLAVLVAVTVFVGRRVWRYPLFLLGGAVLAMLGLHYPWWVPVGVLAGLSTLGALWAWQLPDSFARTVARQVCSEWRHALVYAWRWRRVMRRPISGRARRGSSTGAHWAHRDRSLLIRETAAQRGGKD